MARWNFSRIFSILIVFRRKNLQYEPSLETLLISKFGASSSRILHLSRASLDVASTPLHRPDLPFDAQCHTKSVKVLLGISCVRPSSQRETRGKNTPIGKLGRVSNRRQLAAHFCWLQKHPEDRTATTPKTWPFICEFGAKSLRLEKCPLSGECASKAQLVAHFWGRKT